MADNVEVNIAQNIKMVGSKNKSKLCLLSPISKIRKLRIENHKSKNRKSKIKNRNIENCRFASELVKVLALRSPSPEPSKRNSHSESIEREVEERQSKNAVVKTTGWATLGSEVGDWRKLAKHSNRFQWM